MQFIDAHAHLTSTETDVEPLLQRAHDAGLWGIINVSTHKDDLLRSIALSSTTPRIYTVAAVTPHDADKDDSEFFAEIEKNLPSLIAIGEIGLDYYYKMVSKDAQIKTFKRYLMLAKRANLPVVIHCREAFSDLYQTIEEICPDIKVMLHCFTGTLEEAKLAQEKGWYISLSGIVTFKKSVELQEVAKAIDQEQMHVYPL